MFDLDKIVDDVQPTDELEDVVMGLIINAGQARSLAYKALKHAKTGDFAQAEELMAQSRKALNEAHLVQTQLIEADQGEGKTRVTLVLVHAPGSFDECDVSPRVDFELIELHQKIS